MELLKVAVLRLSLCLYFATWRLRCRRHLVVHGVLAAGFASAAASAAFLRLAARHQSPPSSPSLGPQIFVKTLS